MPVPVPCISKQSAHPVIKSHSHPGDTDFADASVFDNLTCTLPVSPTGPPPSFGTREEWISSLPTWRRKKPRRIWEDETRIAEEGREGENFQGGLIDAGNAPFIKGARAQACIPPLFTLFQTSSQVSAPSSVACEGDADDEMSSDSSVMDQGQYDHESQWSASSPIAGDMMVDPQPELEYDDAAATWRENSAAPGSEHFYEKGAFTPVFEDESPGLGSGQDLGSSPVGPVTPFGEYVDRAVADPAYAAYEANICPGCEDHQYNYEDAYASRCLPVPNQVAPAKVPQGPEPVVTPSADTPYKRLAEPLSEWLASYVWQVCTTGLSLPNVFARPGAHVNRYSPNPPLFLAPSIHSLLLSTLLQPSAILLAVWYIVRLPVYFDAAGLGVDRVEEIRFRSELLGEARSGPQRESLEAQAPFRLFLLGCMLANKWLDDHTFSNKTWHTISNVDILSLNRLEMYAMKIFHHDLSVTPRQWSEWLAHLNSHHQSLASPTHHPQPISRPSSSPYSIVRKAIEELIQASTHDDGITPLSNTEPVFLGLEDRKRERYERENGIQAIDDLEIDLDEDGPLREEYLPKRRVSGARSAHSSISIGKSVDLQHGLKEWEKRADPERMLPPPAKWSPAGDEPILRSRNISGQYLAVQAPLAPPFPALAAYHHMQQSNRYQNWLCNGPYLGGEPMAPGYAYGAQPAYDGATYPYAVPVTNPRYGQASNMPGHGRSQSQTSFDYKCGGMASDELDASRYPDTRWDHYGYAQSYSHPFASRTNLNISQHPLTSWLRT
ncbi:hypothetical protein PLICRDRAFT_98591 [Plicaturopsis crispa FD-325 SS-3]|nr:hypothetical protein PLICRDRAFT_98591 [Plicaturopsis crispa FD-325 SS-3]